MNTQHTPLPPEWTLEATKRFQAIVAHLDQFSTTASNKLAAKVEKALKNIEAFPKMYKPGRFKGTREVDLDTHVLIYQEGGRSSLIVGVFHKRQNWVNI